MRTGPLSALTRTAGCNGFVLGITCATFLLDISPSRAQDVGAITSGSWSNSTVWTSGMSPGAGNNVYIGSSYPSGAALSATVALTQDQQASSVYLGYSSGASGTLNLGSSTLTAVSLYVGDGGTGSVMRTTGSISASNLFVYSGNHFAFGGGDVIGALSMSGSTATTAVIGNVTSSALLDASSTLTLGAALSVSSSVDIRNGSILNAQGYSITANQIFIGWNGNSPVAQLQNRGDLITPNLYVAGQTLNLTSSDSVQNFNLSGGITSLPSGATVASLNLYASSTGTTSATSNITSSVYLDGASTLTLGANLSVPLSVDIRNGSILNAQGYSITANQIFIGWNGNSPLAQLQNRGNLSTPNLYVAGQTLNLTSSDSVQNFNLSGGNTSLPSGATVASLNLYASSTGTTSATSNITSSVYLDGASTLTLGANLSVPSSVDIRNGSIINAQTHSITANQIFIGWNGSSPVAQLQNRGNLITPNLYVAAQNLNLTTSDNVQNFYLNSGNTTLPAGYSLNSLNLGYSASAGTLAPTVTIANLSLYSSSTVTTAATGNITGSVYMDQASTLTLGTDLSVTGAIDIRNGSIINAQTHNMTANQIFLGWNGSSPIAQLQNRGNLSAPYLYVAAQNFNLTSSDNVQNFYLNTGNTTLPAGYSLNSLNLGYSASAGTLAPTVAIANLSLYSSSTVTTAATGNITGSVYMDQASTLTLGADLSVTGAIDIRNGSIINAQTHNMTANQIFLGWNGSSPIAQLQNRGNLTAPYLYVAAQNFNLTSSDNVQNFYLNTGNTTLPAGYSLNSLNLGYSASAGTLAPTVAIANLSLYSSSTVTTAATGNITGSVYMDQASTLTLGADLSVTGAIDIRNGSIINAQTHNMTANQIFLGWNGSSPIAQLQNRGSLTAPYLYVAAQNFNLTSSDNVQNFYLNTGNTTLPAGYSLNSLNLGYSASTGTLAPTVAIANLSLYSSSTVTTAATGNITGSVYMDQSSTLTLGADLSVTGSIDIRNGSTLNAQNHNITATNQIFMGWNGGTAIVQNLAAATTGGWYQSNGTQVTLNNGNSSMTTLNLTGSSNLIVANGPSNPATLTILGTSAGSINIAAGSQLILQMNNLSGAPILSWANPTGGGNHIGDLENLISAGSLTFTGLYGADVYIYSNNSITYIATPEPEWTLLIAAIPLALVRYARRRRGHVVPGIPCTSVG